jgi:hypothetical protein
MSSPISNLSPDMIYSQLDELIEEEKANLKKFQEAHQKYFEVEDRLRKFMKDQNIGKRIATAKMPLEFALNLPSRNFEENETYNMDVFEYEIPVTKKSKFFILPHLKKVKESKEEEEEEKEEEKEKEEQEEEQEEEEEKEEEEKKKKQKKRQ